MTETQGVEGVTENKTGAFLEEMRAQSGYVKKGSQSDEPVKPKEPEPKKAPDTPSDLEARLSKIDKRLDDKDTFITKLQTENKELRDRLSRKPKAKEDGTEGEEGTTTGITLDDVNDLLKVHETSLLEQLKPVFTTVKQMDTTQRIQALYQGDEESKAAIDSLPPEIISQLGDRVSKLTDNFEDEGDPIKESLMFIAHRHGVEPTKTAPSGSDIIPTGSTRAPVGKKSETTKMNEEIFGVKIDDSDGYPVDINE